MNPPNNIQNGFFTPVSPFFSKVRKLTVFSRNPHAPIILQSVRLRMGADGSFVPKTRRSASSACPLQFFGNKKNHMPDARGACRAYDLGFDGGLLLPPPANSFHRLRAVPLPRGGRSGGIRVLSKILIQPRVQGRNPARFNGGYGVPRGFKGGSKPSAPCGRLSEAEHPKRKGATLLRPLSAVNRNLPGNSHSRASAPCDFRFPPCFFPHSGRMAPIPLIP